MPTAHDQGSLLAVGQKGALPRNCCATSGCLMVSGAGDPAGFAVAPLRRLAIPAFGGFILGGWGPFFLLPRARLSAGTASASSPLRPLFFEMSFSGARLQVDRYGVPQYAGEAYEEYAERAWDLYHGRSGSDQTQLATAVHLRSGLTGAAYESVRHLRHSELMTEDAQKKPTVKGTQLLLDTLKEAIAAEQPVKINELFLNAFYSPAVWRRPAENMQQYIVRREQDFKRLEDVLAGSSVPEHIRAMMLLLFGGLDPREQNNVLASVGNTYDFKKIAHAMRMQYPYASGKPVVRRDFLGSSRAAPSFGSPPRQPKGYGKARRQAALVAEMEGEEVPEDGDAGHDDAFESTEVDLADQVDDDEGTFDTWVQDADLDDPEVAEALATLMQKKGQWKGGQKGAPGASQAFPFKASGELSFDQKARESKRQAVQFLKSVTPCTACGMKGHWQGDESCPKRKPGKGQGAAKAKKKPLPKKVPGKTTYFVLHPDLEEGDGAGQAYLVDPQDAGKEPRTRFSNAAEHTGPDLEHDVLVNLRTNLCEHASSNGGREKKFHRSANGHTRSIMCKEPECDKAVIQARRKDAVSLWSFLVQVALCTLWGTKARSRALFSRVGQVRAEALSEREALAREAARERDEDARAQRLQLDRGYGLGSFAGDESPPSGWKLVVNQSAASSLEPAPVARIVRPELQPVRAWVYGVCLSGATELPRFPELTAEDQDILMPLPTENSLCGTESPYCGATFGHVSSSAESAWYCSQVMSFALGNNPI